MKTLGMLLPALLTACSGWPSVTSVPATRATPAGTIKMFRHADRSRGATWDLFSPGFQRRLVGEHRPSGFGGYRVERAWERRMERRVQCVQRPLGHAVIRRVHMQDADRARVEVTTRRGERLEVGLVRLTKWQLFVAGDPQPYEGFAHDPTIRYERNMDGSFTIFAQFDPNAEATQETFAAREIRQFRELMLWYVDSWCRAK